VGLGLLVCAFLVAMLVLKHSPSKPDEAAVHRNLGIALMNKSDLDGAIQEYRKALLLKPDYPEAHNDLGLALTTKGDVDAANRGIPRGAALKTGSRGHA
jgi:protein O-GlcNAc transferase